MLTTLDIQNFRLFEHLRIEGLKRVNLFAGKNNSGKTALLEALRIIASDAHATVVNHIIEQRGQLRPGWEESYDSLFNRERLKAQALGEQLEIKLDTVTIHRILNGSSVPKFRFSTPTSQGEWGSHVPTDYPRDGAVYVPLGGEGFSPLRLLWDKIVLTEYEDDVMNILRETILPDLVRLDVKEDRTLVRLKNESSPVPLKSLGDGAQRLLQLAIALVSARGRILLIDEVEAGLHYSLQETLWEKIFDYASTWDIQVFATTHSSDAIKTFLYILEKPGNNNCGAYFRLQTNRKTSKIEAITYHIERLESAFETKSEIR
jgi:AAA15 family ATPase/GTPase